MMQSRCWLSLLVLALALVPIVASAQPRKRDAIVIFKDGFHIKGKIEERVGEVIYDSASGKSFSIPSGTFYLDDNVRKIIFSPTNVQKVVQYKVGEIKEPMQVLRIKTYIQKYSLLPTWELIDFPEWAGAGDRIVTAKAPKGMIKIEQRIGLFTPQYLSAISTDHIWNPMYFTSEFKPKDVRAMLLKVFEEKKDLKNLKPAEKFLQIAAFLLEAGWFEEAEEELARIVENFPTDKKIAEEMLGKLRKDRANLFAESIKQAVKVGQHQVVLERLDDYAQRGYAKLVTADNRTMASDFAADYAKAKTNIEAARKSLKALPTYVNKQKQAPWQGAAEFIADELNYDTVGRLEKFLLFAQQHETQRAAGCKPTQTAEEVLAMAVSSWLQGDQAADSDTKAALKLAHARASLLEYLSTEGELKRSGLLSGFKNECDLPIDVLAKLMRMIPPPAAHDAKNINTKIQTIKINVPGGIGGSYLVQLPPDYHHQRAYPVVLVHSSVKAPEDLVKEFSAEAAKHGFIVAAPLWNGKAVHGARYQYSKREQDIVLDTLRDLRRRFQVDSDRVFLFGGEQGGNLAFDVGLGHPDQFAGVVAMNGNLTPFAQKFYWPNAQYLPFYVIQGELNGGNPKQMFGLFKDHWTREPFASMYVEYKGRGFEWFSAEIPLAMTWMSKKKRHTPMREMGRADANGRLFEEFRSSRESDARFYWLSSDAIEDHRLKDPTTDIKAIPGLYKPATFQATFTPGNKSKKDGTAEIWNQVYLRVNGMKQVTFWITPDMMDLALPLQIHVNGQKAGQRRAIPVNIGTMLEELYQSGDRQRLFVAKIDIKM